MPGNTASVNSNGEPRSLHESARASLLRSADLAEAIASTFERMAATYRAMAEGARSPDSSKRLLGHAARLENRADLERAAAEQMQVRYQPEGFRP